MVFRRVPFAVALTAKIVAARIVHDKGEKCRGVIVCSVARVAFRLVGCVPWKLPWIL